MEIFNSNCFRIIAVLTAILPVFCEASGMVPETSVLVVEEQDGESSMTITNSDNHPMLLTTSIKGIAQDKEKLIIATPPAIRVEGGKRQLVRFILVSGAPLKTERLRRVVFSGIPPQSKGKNEVRMSVSQNIPVIIRPAGLPRDDAPWKRLNWKLTAGKLSVTNESPYVVRLAQSVKVLPGNDVALLPQSYILPGERITLNAASGKGINQGDHVQISPATTWGFSVDTFNAPLSQ
ncbi:fimbria/pilus chaperone family protein [Serratia fonticola]|uniref:fimbria/pilus chaperone family protein n=1 Tax=Serratia fonticola TaxID=47917 RepID=UPI0024DE0B04|nr:fimbria/pilus chaperone family protein [Serratia fonticola]MDK2375049.1 fimbria/pilus chaperone family protein [Serratia fonticola]